MSARTSGKGAWFLLIFPLIGVGLLAATAWMIDSTRDFIARAGTASGTVIELVRKRSSDNDGDTYAPRVRFDTPQRRDIEFTSSVSSSPPDFTVGESVRVLYDPAAPEDAKVDSFLQLWLGPLIFGILGTAFTGASVAVLVVLKRTGASTQRLRTEGRPVLATLGRIERNDNMRVDGVTPWRITAHWEDPLTRKSYEFVSENLWADPTAFARRQLTVYIDPNNPRKYTMDLSFLPQPADRGA